MNGGWDSSWVSEIWRKRLICINVFLMSKMEEASWFLWGSILSFACQETLANNRGKPSLKFPAPTHGLSCSHRQWNVKLGGPLLEGAKGELHEKAWTSLFIWREICYFREKTGQNSRKNYEKSIIMKEL